MDGNISEMLQSVLSDPETMKKLMNVAGGIMGGNSPSEASPVSAGQSSSDEVEESSDIGAAATSLKGLFSDSVGKPGNDERIALVKAIRPYLSESRRQTADGILNLMKILKLADLGKLIK